MAGKLNINQGVTVTVNQGSTLSSGVVQLNGTNNGGGIFSVLVLAGTGTQTLSGTGQLIFAAPTLPSASADQVYSSQGALTVGPGLSVTDTTGSGTLGSSGQLLTLNGTVTASGGQTIAVIGSSVTNAGSGSNAPSLQGNGGTLTITNLQSNAGGIAATNSGTVTLNGAWQNTGTISEIASGTVNLGGDFHQHRNHHPPACSPPPTAR